VTFDPETAEIGSVIVTALWKLSIFRHCRASHTYKDHWMTEPRLTKFCQTLEGLRGLLSIVIFLGKFVPSLSWNFWPIRFSRIATSSLNTGYLMNETSHQQNKSTMCPQKSDLLSVFSRASQLNWPCLQQSTCTSYRRNKTMSYQNL